MDEARDVSTLARHVVATLTERGHSVAVAESLTGGLVCASLTDVPGASACVRGGVVSYAVDVKVDVLGVDAEVLARVGAVDPAVAVAMAEGVRRLLGATYGVATTGAAGPDPAPGGSQTSDVPAGRGFVAVCGPGADAVQGFAVEPDGRNVVRAAAVHAALRLLAQELST